MAFRSLPAGKFIIMADDAGVSFTGSKIDNVGGAPELVMASAELDQDSAVSRVRD